jgi:saccharopine dehydrogenase-like NADP-dependent oxidoreductase
MRILALGGCGLMGRYFVETTLALDTFAWMTIADRDQAAASRYAQSLGHPHVDAVQIDATDRAGLVALLLRYDLVVSTIGPYYRFGTAVLECAIEAGCHYVDICDDPEPTLAMLALHDRAAAAGITALVGMGASPGISNLLATKAIRAVGQAERVVTTWGSTSSAKESADADVDLGAAVDHWFAQLTGRIPMHADGRSVTARPLSEVVLQVPGLGRLKAHTVGHPEPLTLPRAFPFIRDSVNVMLFSRPLIQLLKVLQRRVDSGRHTVAEAAALFRKLIRNVDWAELTWRESSSLLMSSALEAVFPTSYIPSELSALAETRAGDRRRICSAWLNGEIPGGMGANTGIPTALAVQMLAQGLIGRSGVFAPEQVIEPDAFFQRLTPFVKRKNPAAPIVVIQTTMA